MSPEIQAAWILGICGIVGTVIASLAAVVVGQKFNARKKLEQDLDVAKKDIEFLLEVESRHCDIHRETSDRSNKIRIRSQVLAAGRYAWSGRFTRGRNRQN